MEITVKSAIARVGEVLKLAVQFTGLDTEPLKAQVRQAMDVAATGKRQAAIELLLRLEEGGKLLMLGFFRNSPKWFSRQIQKLEQAGVDPDIIADLRVQRETLLAMAREQEIVLLDALKLYGDLYAAIEEAPRKQQQRGREDADEIGSLLEILHAA